MNTDLVMVVHVDQNYASQLFRRIYLSGWSKQKGFYEQTSPNEPQQIFRIPKDHAQLPHQPFLYRETVSQEIFTVNIAPDSLIALEYPVAVSPYAVWDTVRFKGAYKVESSVLDGVPLDLITAEPPSGDHAEGLGKEALAFYTAIDVETKALMFPIAESVTAPFARYYDKVYALLDYFREGEYRYSLSPGEAPDGDKLRYFVTESKKGYCSYFAFAYCLMLRSLGIPSRLAAGFFLQPESGVLNYYPVRANMAHAWVQVFFPYLGWVDIDPTTQQFAAGEEMDSTFQAGGTQFTELLNEILLNRSSLSLQHKDAPPLTKQIAGFVSLHRRGFVVGMLFAIVLMVCASHLYPRLIITFSQNKRKVILMFKRIHKHPSATFIALTQKAKFAPSCTDEDVIRVRELYRAEKRRVARTAKRPPKGTVFLLLLLLLSPLPLFPASAAHELLERADTALEAENWDAAIALLEEGIAHYPANEVFQLKLGDMYFNKGLYELAYHRFTEGLELNRHNIKLLYGAANAAAALNEEEKARTFLHEYLTLNPTDIFGWSTYGWLCFKTHRIDEGIQAMLDARRNYGDDGCLANALGNLYGELLDYQHAAFYYQKGIDLALQNNLFYSASVYCYNKAILETEFYHFEQAEKDAHDAASYFSRSSGFLVLGELEERKNHFARALHYYRQAMKNNPTPLPLINLAKMYLRMGHWEKAEHAIKQIERTTDSSWIANFGMSTVLFYTELYQLYLSLYEKKYTAENMRVPESTKDIFLRAKNLIVYTSLIWYYRAQVSIYNLKLAREYAQASEGGNTHKLYTQSFYYKAFKQVPYKAGRYLRRAENLETSIIPNAGPSYIAERGMVRGDERLLQEALNTLDPVWEKNIREQAAAALIGCTQNSTLKTDLTKELLKNNPACLAEHGIRLPIQISVRSTQGTFKKDTEYYLATALQKSLFTITANAPFSLTVAYTPSTVHLSLTDKDGTVYFRYTHQAPVSGTYPAAVCVNAFTKHLFRIQEGH